MDIQYSPLDPSEEEIRLLQIDCSSSRRHVLIPKVALRKGRQRFNALSYPWGKGIEHSSSVMNVDDRKVHVSDNLHSAIDALVKFWSQTYPTDGPRLLLWCDQICIDQASADEKSHQVGFMSEIYKRADTVLVWLPLPSGISAGFEQWPEWKIWLEKQTRRDELLDAFSKSSSTTGSKLGGAEGKSEGQAGPIFKSLVESAWWSRAWVYQEFMLATTAIFLIDGLAISWLDLNDLLTTYFDGIEHHHETIDMFIQSSEVKIQQAEASTLAATKKRRKLDTKRGKKDKSLWRHCNTWNKSMEKRISWNPSAIMDYHAEFFDAMYPESMWTLRIIFKLPFWIFAHFASLILCIGLVILFSLFYLPHSIIYCLSLPWRHDPKETMEAKYLELGQVADSQAKQALRIKENLTTHVQNYHQNLDNAAKSYAVSKFILSSTSKSSAADGLPVLLSTLIKHSRNCECTDPRDKIFAFLGLAGPSYAIVPDYRPSNTLNNVLVEATAAIIRTENSLNILNDAREIDSFPSVVDHLPSWVPNFTRPDKLNSEYYRFIEGIGLPANCKADWHLPPVVDFLEDRNGNRDRILKCRGRRVCRLGKMVPESDYAKPWRLFESDEASGTGNGMLLVGTGRAARAGDEVWVLFGADVPFCLSKPSERDSYYQLVGQAMLWNGKEGRRSDYMYGAMRNKIGAVDGEVMII